MAGVLLAIVLSAAAYRRLPARGAKTSGKGIGLSVAAGLLMGYSYRSVAASMSENFRELGPGSPRCSPPSSSACR